MRMLFSAFLLAACTAATVSAVRLAVASEPVATTIRVRTSWGATTGLGDSVILTHFVGSYPGAPDSIRKAYRTGAARTDTVTFSPPQGYSITGLVYVRLKSGTALGPRDSVSWSNSLPLTNRVPAFSIATDTL